MTLAYRWTLYNERPIKGDNYSLADPVRETFYIYTTKVNALGDEFGNPSEIQKLVPGA